MQWLYFLRVFLRLIYGEVTSWNGLVVNVCVLKNPQQIKPFKNHTLTRCARYQSYPSNMFSVCSVCFPNKPQKNHKPGFKYTIHKRGTKLFELISCSHGYLQTDMCPVRARLLYDCFSCLLIERKFQMNILPRLYQGQTECLSWLRLCDSIKDKWRFPGSFWEPSFVLDSIAIAAAMIAFICPWWHCHSCSHDRLHLSLMALP